MERADALPRTALYETASLDATEPGALLRKEPFVGYAIPAGAKAVQEPYHPGAASEMWVATIADPDDNYFQLMSPMEPPQ